jgi:hypothetical protein
MTNSRSSGWALAALAVLGLAIGSGRASAAGKIPVPRQRPQTAASAPAPPTPAPAPASAPASAADPLSNPAASVDAGTGFSNPFAPIESQPLSKVSQGLVGLLDARHGGFSQDLWNGTDRLVVETLLPQLPVPRASPAESALLRRLLLSRVQPPQGATNEISLLAARLQLAIASGQIGAVEPLAQQAPDQINDPDIVGPRVDALFYEGKDNEACGLAGGVKGRSGDAAWVKRLAYCSALDGRVSEARMSVDVLADTGTPAPEFAALMGKLTDKAKVKSVKFSKPEAVDFALLRKTGVHLDPATLATADPSFDTAWAAYQKAPLDQRLTAAELAVSDGVLPVGALVNLYKRVKLSKRLIDKSFAAKRMPAGTHGAAYVVQRLAKTKDDSERGALIAAALEAARDRGVLPAVAMALHANIASLPAVPALADVAPVLGVGEAISGDGVMARRWYDLMRAQNTEASEKGRALRSILAVRGGAPDLGWAPDDFLLRINTAETPQDKARASLEWDLLTALGTPDSKSIWVKTLEGPLEVTAPAPTTSVVDGLRAASLRGRVGETVLFALIALGEAGPRGVDPAALVDAVKALNRVGLDNDASAIAAEALAWRMP